MKCHMVMLHNVKARRYIKHSYKPMFYRLSAGNNIMYEECFIGTYEYAWIRVDSVKQFYTRLTATICLLLDGVIHCQNSRKCVTAYYLSLMSGIGVDLQKIGLPHSEPVFMPKIKSIGPTVRAGEALKDKHIRKQYIWMWADQIIHNKHVTRSLGHRFLLGSITLHMCECEICQQLPYITLLYLN